MIVSFKDDGTEDVFDGRDTKKARKACPSDLVKVARRKLDQVNQAARLDDLRVPPNNHLEKLKGDREGPALHQGERPVAGVLPVERRGGGGGGDS